MLLTDDDGGMGRGVLFEATGSVDEGLGFVGRGEGSGGGWGVRGVDSVIVKGGGGRGLLVAG